MHSYHLIIASLQLRQQHLLFFLRSLARRFPLPLFVALARRHEVLVVLLPLLSRQSRLRPAIRVLAELGILAVPRHALRRRVALAVLLEILKVPHELRLLERLAVGAVGILA